MSDHTPGPWTIEEYGDDNAPALVIHSNRDNRICFMPLAGSHGDPKEIEANAHLIVAAPDMKAEIERLRHSQELLKLSLAVQVEHTQKLEAEIERLRTAALPFAQHDWMDAKLEDDNCKLTQHSGPVTVGHWRRLRAALEGKP
jgi:hypothetical protein